MIDFLQKLKKVVHIVLKLLTHVGFFFRKQDQILSELSVLIYGKEQESRKKIFHNRVKKFTFLRRFDCRKTFFLDIKKSNSKKLFSNGSKCITITRG